MPCPPVISVRGVCGASVGCTGLRLVRSGYVWGRFWAGAPAAPRPPTQATQDPEFKFGRSRSSPEPSRIMGTTITLSLPWEAWGTRGVHTRGHSGWVAILGGARAAAGPHLPPARVTPYRNRPFPGRTIDATIDGTPPGDKFPTTGERSRGRNPAS